MSAHRKKWAVQHHRVPLFQIARQLEAILMPDMANNLKLDMVNILKVSQINLANQITVLLGPSIMLRYDSYRMKHSTYNTCN